jgi:hypothetical protein
VQALLLLSSRLYKETTFVSMIAKHWSRSSTVDELHGTTMLFFGIWEITVQHSVYYIHFTTSL